MSELEQRVMAEQEQRIREAGKMLLALTEENEALKALVNLLKDVIMTAGEEFNLNPLLAERDYLQRLVDEMRASDLIQAKRTLEAEGIKEPETLKGRI